MYIRPVHAETDPEVLYPFVRANPLGLFTTSLKNPSIPTLQTTHIPFVLDTPPAGPARLRGHIARANPQTKAILDAVDADGYLEDEVLILFQTPVHHYVTPKFYTETKPATGKVTPTWNYAAVQIYGRLKAHHSGSAASAFLQQQVTDLTDLSERAQGHPRPWKVTEAPERYIEILKKGIIGLDVEITRIEGRWKLSQELDEGDWKGTVEGFKSLGTVTGTQMAELIEAKGQEQA